MIEVPPLPNPDVETDWAELSCLFRKNQSLSRSEVEKALEEAGVDDPELTIENIWREITWRHYITPESHPIIASQDRLQRVRTWRRAFSYAFMLLLTCQSFYESTRVSKRQWPKTAKLFERLTTAAMERYLGRAINIGAPRRGGVPRSFKKCLDFICDKTKELRGPVSQFRKWSKDEGVDVISWHPFDERSGQVIILVQCGAGATWQEKTMEISLPVWREYIDFVTDPMTALAFPDVCHNDWMYLSKQSGVLLDRLRIASLVPKNMTFPLRRELIDWSKQQLRGLQWAT